MAVVTNAPRSSVGGSICSVVSTCWADAARVVVVCGLLAGEAIVVVTANGLPAAATAAVALVGVDVVSAEIVAWKLGVSTVVVLINVALSVLRLRGVVKAHL